VSLLSLIVLVGGSMAGSVKAANGGRHAYLVFQKCEGLCFGCQLNDGRVRGNE